MINNEPNGSKVATLTEAGTFAFESITFKRIDNLWKAVAIKQKEHPRDEE